MAPKAASRADVQEKNKKKLKRTISQVVKSLSSLNLNEQNSELRSLQRQLHALNQQLYVPKTDEVNSVKKKVRALTKKCKQVNDEQETREEREGKKVGSHILLPLGIGVSLPVRSNVHAQKYRNKVSSQVVKTSQRQNVFKSDSSKNTIERRSKKKFDKRVKCTISENELESKKKKKKVRELKGIKELSDKKKMEVNLEMKSKMKKLEKSEAKKKRRKEREKEKTEAKLPDESIFLSLSEKYYFLTAIEDTKKKKETVEVEEKVRSLSNHLSSSEQYYFLTSLEGFETKKEAGESANKNSNLTSMEKSRSHKEQNKIVSLVSDIPRNKSRKETNVEKSAMREAKIKPTDLKKERKQKSSEKEGLSFSNFLSLSEEYYFLTTLEDCKENNDTVELSNKGSISSALENSSCQQSKDASLVSDILTKKSKKKTNLEHSALKDRKETADLKKERKQKKSEKESPSFSNFLSLSEEYYFLTALGDCKENNEIVEFSSKGSISSSPENSSCHQSKGISLISDSSTKKSKKKTNLKHSTLKEKKEPAELKSLEKSLKHLILTYHETQNEDENSISDNFGRKSGKKANGEDSSEVETSKKKNSDVDKKLKDSKMLTLADLERKLLRKEKKKNKKLTAGGNDNKLTENIKIVMSDSNIPENSSSSPSKFSKEKTYKKKGKSSSGRVRSRLSEREDDQFENYLTEYEVFAGLQNKYLICGQIRINIKDYNVAYVSAEDRSESDYLIEGICNRNRALEGDIVVLSILPEHKWKVLSPFCKQKTAKVVYIKEAVHSRRGIGVIKIMADKNPENALFSPNDSRLPRWQVPMYSCPPDFYKNPSKYQNTYFEAVLIRWVTPKLSEGFITQMLGEKNSVETESISLLCEADCDITPIPQSIFEDSMKNIVLDENIFSKRQDLRCECIFSIDPQGAKDLDDALSCKQLPNGNFEIGVHISDVAFYIEQGTPFDKAVCKKATTVYLVQKAYHMLPQELCYLCSLTPGEDKLAFSVFWEMTPSAEIISHRFTRSIIHSCVQLTYSHAQKVIDNPDAESYDFPPVLNGYSEKDCADRIIILNKLAAIMRKNRFDNGALKIEIPKLHFDLNFESGLPVSCSKYLCFESNWLIEEFMLLANFSVGRQIFNFYPDIALLRSHGEPNEVALKELKSDLEKEGMFLDTSSAASIYQFISQFDGDNFESEARRAVLSNLIAKPMPKARYYSSGLQQNESDFWHFALNNSHYTHFTSPIRRYADIVVHRMLAASLGYCPKPDYSPEEIQKIANISNKQKYCAKKAGELSAKLFLTLYISNYGPLVEKAAVLDVKDHSFDAVILRFNHIVRVYTNNLTKDAKVAHDAKENGMSSIFIYWKENAEKNIKNSIQLIKLFSVVAIELKKAEKDFKIETRLLPFC